MAIQWDISRWTTEFSLLLKYTLLKKIMKLKKFLLCTSIIKDGEFSNILIVLLKSIRNQWCLLITNIKKVKQTIDYNIKQCLGNQDKTIFNFLKFSLVKLK